MTIPTSWYEVDNMADVVSWVTREALHHHQQLGGKATLVQVTADAAVIAADFSVGDEKWTVGIGPVRGLDERHVVRTVSGFVWDRLLPEWDRQVTAKGTP